MVRLSKTQMILVFEGIATLMLAFGVSNSSKSVLGDTFVAISLLAGIMISAPFTGGHVNPAVSFGIFCERSRPISFSDLLIYWLGQVIGGTLGGLFSWFCTGEINGPDYTFVSGSGFIGDVLSEFIGTFIFVCTILILVHDQTNFTPNSFLCWMIIAVALFFSRHFAIHTGGCLNPAVAIGLQFSTGIILGNWHPLANCWVFLVGPLAGALCAAIYYNMVYQAAYPRKSAS